MGFLELKPGLDREKATTNCLRYGATAHVFNSSMSLGGLKSNYSPGQRSFTFIVPLYVFTTTQYAEASTEGLMFSITHGRKWMPSVNCFCFLNVCKSFPCCCLVIYLHRTNSLKDIFPSFELNHLQKFIHVESTSVSYF